MKGFEVELKVLFKRDRVQGCQGRLGVQGRQVNTGEIGGQGRQ